MSMIKDYIEKGGGNFLTTKTCAIGATVTIKTVALDEETFDKAYVVCNGIYDPTGEECNVRLGVQNIKRIAEVLGDDESKWPEKKIQCITHQDYPGLGTKGLLWAAVGGTAVAPPAAQEMPAIIGKIMVAHPELTAQAVKKLIDEEVVKAAGLLTEEASAHIVASNLGVDLK